MDERNKNTLTDIFKAKIYKSKVYLLNIVALSLEILTIFTQTLLSTDTPLTCVKLPLNNTVPSTPIVFHL